MATEILTTTDNPFLMPLENKAIDVQIKNIISDMVEITKTMIVESESSYKNITSLYRQAREWKKCIDAKRKDLTDPLRKQASAINDKAKELTDPLDSVIDMANAKANHYRLMLEEIKRNEDDKLKAAAALFDSEDEIYIPPMAAVPRGEGTTTVTKSDKRFRLVDITKVPTKYLMVDEDAIKKDLRLGISEIPGLEIYTETTTQLRIR